MPSSLALLLLAASILRDEPGDQYQFIVGLVDKKMHEMVVAEAESFLSKWPRHEKAPLARYRLANALYDLDRFEDAAPHFRRLMIVNGFELEAESAFRLAECELRQDRFDAAKSALERVLGTKKEYLDLPARFLLGETAFRSAQYADAKTRYEEILAKDPRGVHAKDARYGVAWCSFRLGAFDEALSRIDEFLRLHRGDRLEGELVFLRGECMLESGRAQDALKAYRAVTDGPFLDAALRGTGFALAHLGDSRGAASAFATLIQKLPQSRFAAEATLQCGIHQLKAKDAAAAVKTLSSATANVDAQLLYWRARAKAETGDKNGALADLEHALGAQPENELKERCEVARGDLLFDLGRTDAAAEAYGKSASDYALHAAAVASLNEGKHGDARRMADELLKRHPQSSFAPVMRLVRGECLMQGEEYVEAAQEFARAEEDTSDTATRLRARSRRAWCAFLGGDHAGAAGHFAKVADAGKGTTEHEDALFMLGRSLEAAGRAKDAVRALDAYLAEYGGGIHRADALLGLARLDAETSTARLEELLAKHADHEAVPEALFRLAERQQKEGRRDEAEKNYRRLLERFPSHAAALPAAYGLAWCLYDAERFADAANVLTQIASRRDVDPAMRTASLELLVFSQQKAKNARGVVEAFDAFRRADPNPDKLLAAGRAAAETLKELGNQADADALLATLSNAGTEVGAAARIERAWLALESGDVAKADQLLQSAIRGDAATPEVAEAAFYVAEAWFEKGEDARAIPLYELAARTGGSKVADDALYKAGFARLRANDLDGAARSFALLTENHEKSPLAGEGLYLHGEVLYRLERFAEAIGPLEKLRRTVPNHETMPKALFRLGVAHCRTANFAEGEDALTDLARRFPKFENAAEAELWRGRALVARDNARGARQAFDRVLALDRGVLAARARIELGRLSFDEGDVEKALAEFLKVAVLYGTEAEVTEGLYLAGLCLEKLGDPNRAKSQYQEIVQKYPSSPHAAEARERLAELKAL